MFTPFLKHLACLILLGSFVLSGCGTEAETRLIVVLHTDVPAELNRIQIDAQNLLSGTLLTDSIQPVNWSEAGCGSFVIQAKEGQQQAELSIELIATGPSTLITREIRTKFSPKANQALYIELPKSCDGISCSQRNTCTENGCQSSQISAEVLKEVEIGQEFEAFSKCSP